MSPLARRAGIASVAVAGLILFAALTILFVPSSQLQQLATRAAANQGLVLTAVGFGKAFPVGIKAEDLTIAGGSGPLIRFDRLALRLRLIPLCAGRVVITCRGAIGKGELQGELELTRKGNLEFSVQGIRLEDIPFFTSVANAQARGELLLRGKLRGRGAAADGTLQAEVRGLDLRGVKISGTPLPDASYTASQGMVRISGGRITLESVTLQGEGLYVRLRGDMPADKPPAATELNLTLELMPKPDYLDRQKFVFLLLTKYLSSPGVYQVPIRGTLAQPLLQ